MWDKKGERKNQGGKKVGKETRKILICLEKSERVNFATKFIDWHVAEVTLVVTTPKGIRADFKRRRSFIRPQASLNWASNVFGVAYQTYFSTKLFESNKRILFWPCIISPSPLKADIKKGVLYCRPLFKVGYPWLNKTFTTFSFHLEFLTFLLSGIT